MRVLLVINSKTGFTKKYADWISEEITCSVQSYQDFLRTPTDADMVIFGSRVHAGRIEYLNKIKPRFKNDPTRQLIIFATGATPASVENVIEKIWAENLTDAEIKSIPHFYMQSGLNYEKMGFLDRTIMKVVSRLLGSKTVKNDEESGFEQAIRASHDISSKEYIKPLVRYVRARK